MMDGNQLSYALHPRPLRFFATTGSTNADALAWLNEDPDLPSGAIVIADEQVQGRGRLGRAWQTPPGSAIAMSLILRDLPSPQQATMLAAVAVAEALEPIAPGMVTLKWANDVLVDGKKICGILAEAIWQADKIKAVILGMGINVAVDFRGSELENIAISLNHVTAQPIDRIGLIVGILSRLDYWQNAMQTGQFGELPLFHAWKKRLITLGQVVNIYAAGNQMATGKALDVDQDGALLVETAPGKVERFLAGDVSVRRAES